MNDPYDHARSVYSQHGEDGIVEWLLEKLNLPKPWYCVDVGAWDGVHFSNVRHVLEKPGTKGLLIEAERERWVAMEKNYPVERFPDVQCVHRRVELDGGSSLDCLLNARSWPSEVTLMSIDIDGDDIELFNGSLCWPAIAVIEFNRTFPPHVFFQQHRGERIGSSLLAVKTIAEGGGYDLVCVQGCNAIFVHKSYYAALDLVPAPLAYHYEHGRTDETFFIGSGYDGRIFRGAAWPYNCVYLDDLESLKARGNYYEEHDAKRVYLDPV